MTAKAMPSIVHTPAARPSMPSEKLTTFIIPTSQITVSTPPAFGNCRPPMKGSVMSVTTAPASTAITAAAICPRSLTAGCRSRTSSIAPTNVIRPAPAITHHMWTVPPEPGGVWATCGSLSVGSSQIAPATRTASRMASPPSSGVSFRARPAITGHVDGPHPPGHSGGQGRDRRRHRERDQEREARHPSKACPGSMAARADHSITQP